jgi:protein-S-isoprenylcysteine O-methyltransferase Ste14
LPLFLSPTTSGLIPAAKDVVILGIMLQIFSLVSLNRSFAIVAASRKIKTRGMYRVVRHPLYFSYILMYTGYILANTSLLNFAIYFLTVGFMFVRMTREEKHLSRDFTYVAYMQKVRYRVIPFLI